MRPLLMIALMPCAVWGQNLLQNPGFEPPDQGGLANTWANNTWGNCETKFSLDEQNPHSGTTCQRVECVRRDSGASQFLQRIKLEAGKYYTVRLWVRASGGVPWVGATLRLVPPPYKAYLRDTIEPGRDWELLEFAGVCLADVEDAGLFIWFQADGSGTVWVDDASVEAGEPPVVTGPPPEGNVVPNGSFEVEPTRTWDSMGRIWDWPCEETPAHGRRCLHYRVTPETGFRLRTPCIEFNGNDEAFTLACSARATGGPVTLNTRLLSAVQVAQSAPLLALKATPDGDTRRYSVSGNVPCSPNGAYFLEVTGSAQQEGEVWLDAVSLSRSGEAFTPARPIEAALSTDRLASVFAPDESVSLSLWLSNEGPGTAGGLRVVVRDYGEAPVCEVPVAAEVTAGDRWEGDVQLPVGKLGAFRADVLDGAGTVLASQVFSVIPRPKPVDPAVSVMGGHFATSSDWQMQVANRLGYRWTRIHDCSSITHWRTAEPNLGEWRFFDDEVQRVRSAGLCILGEFLQVPNWATTAEKGSEAYSTGRGPFRDMGEFERYVETVVGHYKGDISHWEIWNEPYGGFWGGTAEKYAEMAQVACRAARRADPDCLLLAPCIYPLATDWFEAAQKAGAIADADIFSYHGYGCTTKAPYDVVNQWATRNGQMMRRWNTETGVTARTLYRHVPDKLDDSYTRGIGGEDAPEAVRQALKLLALAIAGGAERYFYYWTNVETAMLPRLTSMSIYEYDRSIRPHGVVQAIAGSIIDPCKGAGIVDVGGAVCCLLQKEDEAVAVVWAKGKLSARDVRLRGLPDGSHCLDVMGNPRASARDGELRVSVSGTPAYIITPGGAEGLRAALEAALGEG